VLSRWVYGATTSSQQGHLQIPFTARRPGIALAPSRRVFNQAAQSGHSLGTERFMHNLISVALITGAGFCFMLANLVMKTMGAAPFYILYPAVGITFAAGAYFEVEALKQAQLGYAVTFILGCDLLFSLVIAILFLRETYSTSNIFGIALVVVGIALLHLPNDRNVAEQHSISIRGLLSAQIFEGIRPQPETSGHPRPSSTSPEEMANFRIQ
jgi:multidrug transporter EmrE-like cation transporter